MASHTGVVGLQAETLLVLHSAQAPLPRHTGLPDEQARVAALPKSPLHARHVPFVGSQIPVLPLHSEVFEVEQIVHFPASGPVVLHAGASAPQAPLVPLPKSPSHGTQLPSLPQEGRKESGHAAGVPAPKAPSQARQPAPERGASAGAGTQIGAVGDRQATSFADVGVTPLEILQSAHTPIIGPLVMQKGRSCVGHGLKPAVAKFPVQAMHIVVG